MSAPDPAAVRLLAVWLRRRRALTERVESLLLHGPTAVERVTDRADELRAGYAAEQDALEALFAHRRGRTGQDDAVPDRPAGRPPAVAPGAPSGEPRRTSQTDGPVRGPGSAAAGPGSPPEGAYPALRSVPAGAGTDAVSPAGRS